MKATAKRRRTKAEIKMDKLKAEQKEADIAKQLSDLDELKKQMLQMQQQLAQNQVDNTKINQVQGLLEQGVLKVNEGHDIEVVTDPEESEMIRLSQFDDAQSQ